MEKLLLFSRTDMFIVSGNALAPVSGDDLYSDLINPFFTMGGDTVKVSVSVKYLDQKTKAAQISQFDLKLKKQVVTGKL